MSIPAWVRDYVGIQFTPRGRRRDEGLDCWGLIRLVYAEQWGVYLPSFDADYADVTDAAGVAAVAQACVGPRELVHGGPVVAPAHWTPLDESSAKCGDLVRFRLANDLVHVGMVVGPGEMLHAFPGCDSCKERYDRPTWVRRVVAHLRYQGPLTIAGGGPLDSQVRLQLPAGGSIDDILAAAGIKTGPSLRVWVSGREVNREHWRHVRPRPGRLVTVAAIPQGGQQGGKDAARLLATVAIIVASVYLGPELAAGLNFTATGSAAAIATAAISLAGTLALNALVPPPRQRMGNTNDISRYAISGTQNQARRFEAVPFVAGRVRIAPPYGALPYVENVGDDQYLRVLFAPCYGPVNFSDFKIGDTPIENFEDVEIETRPGREDDEPISLYPSTILEDAYSVLLSQEAGWVQRTSRNAVNELSIDLTFPRGLVKIDAIRGRLEAVVEFEIEYAPAGSGAWVPVNTGSPDFTRGLDLRFRQPEVTLLGNKVISTGIAWGLGFPDAKPAELPATNYSWRAFGEIFAQQPGEYVFAIDGSDACDLQIDGRIVVSWYGSHSPVGGNAAPPDFSAHQGTVFLAPGWHQIRIRVDVRSSTGAIAVGWKQPNDSVVAAIDPLYLRPTTPPVAGNSLGTAWFDTQNTLGRTRVGAARTEQLRRSIAWAVEPGQYDIRIRRLTDDSNSDTLIDECYLTSIRVIRADDPVRLSRVAKIGLRIKATDQLQGVIDTFNCLATSVCKDFDEATGQWIEQETSTPASIYRHVLQGPAIRRPIPDDRLALTDLEAWARETRAAGMEINGIFDSRGTAYETLNSICAAGKASFGLLDGKFGVVRDVLQTVPVQHFTPRNSRGFRGTRTFSQAPHGLRCRFKNEAKGYDDDERIVLADGYSIDGRNAWDELDPDATPATEFETLDLFGVTSWEQVFKLGRYHMAVMALRPETYELEVDWEHLVCSRGDLVLITHDVPMFGLQVGRISRLIVDGSNNLVGFDLDERITMDAGDAYGIRVRLEDGSSWQRGIVTVEGNTTTVTLGGPVSPTETRPKLGNLFAFGRVGQESRECIVKAIEPGPDLSARLVLVDAAPAVHQAADGEIPPYDPGISEPTEYTDRPETPIIEQVRSDDLVMVRDADGSLRNRMLITLRRPSSTRPLGTIGQVRTRPLPAGGGAAIGPWQTHPYQPLAAQQLSVYDVEEGTTYEIKLRTLTADGRASDWASTTHTVIGKSALPPDVVSGEVAVLSDGTRQYTWGFATQTPPDLAGVLIRYGAIGAPWHSLTPLTSAAIEASPWDSNEPPAGTWEFAFKAIDTSGNESAAEYRITRTLTDPSLEDVAFSVDCARAGWTGTKTGCHVTGLVLEADDLSTWATMPARWDQTSRWNDRPVSPITYEHVLDAGSVLSFSPDAIAAGDGQLEVSVAWSTDGLSYTAYAAVGDVRGRMVSARYLKARVSCNLTPAALVPVISALTVIMRARQVTHEIQDLDTSTLTPQRRAAAGDVRIPIPAGRFSQIRGLTLGFNGAGGGRTWELVDRDTTLGPRVRLYDSSGALADATIDVVVRGF